MKFEDYFIIKKKKDGLIVRTKIELLKQQKKLLIENVIKTKSSQNK